MFSSKASGCFTPLSIPFMSGDVKSCNFAQSLAQHSPCIPQDLLIFAWAPHDLQCPSTLICIKFDFSLRRLLKSIPLPQLRDPRNSCFATLSSARSCVVMPRSNSSDKTRKTWESRISQKGSTFYIGLSPCPFYMRGSLFLTLISTVTGRTNPNFIYLNHCKS